jgi:hypothetical protein
MHGAQCGPSGSITYDTVWVHVLWKSIMKTVAASSLIIRDIYCGTLFSEPIFHTAPS